MFPRTEDGPFTALLARRVLLEGKVTHCGDFPQERYFSLLKAKPKSSQATAKGTKRHIDNSFYPVNAN